MWAGRVRKRTQGECESGPFAAWWRWLIPGPIMVPPLTFANPGSRPGQAFDRMGWPLPCCFSTDVVERSFSDSPYFSVR